MARFLCVASPNGPADEGGSLIVNLDRVRLIDQIRPGHCRLVFASDHTLLLDGPTADSLPGSAVALGPAPDSPVLPADDGAGNYTLQVRQSPEEEWHDVGPAADSGTGLNCGRLLAGNQCPCFQGAGRLHVRLLDAAGKAVWILD